MFFFLLEGSFFLVIILRDFNNFNLEERRFVVIFFLDFISFLKDFFLCINIFLIRSNDYLFLIKFSVEVIR